MRITICFLFCVWSLLGVAQTRGYQKLWEIKEDFKRPNAVVYDKTNNVYYVANQNKTYFDEGYDYGKPNDGFISKVSPQGKIIALKWIEGFSDPADLFVKDNQLYVADDDFLVIADIAQGSIIKRVNATEIVSKEEAPVKIVSLDVDNKTTGTMPPPPPPPESTRLSSVTGSPDGNIFIRDRGRKSIYIWKDNKLALLISDERLDDDSDIIWDAPTGKLWALNSSRIAAISPKEKSIVDIPIGAAAPPMSIVSPAMGIATMPDSYVIVNSFNVVYELKEGKLTELFQAGDKCKCHTDIEFQSGEIVILDSNLHTLISYKRQ